MLDLKPVFYVIGILLSVLSVGLVAPMLIDLYMGNEDWKVFFLCSVITAFFGGSLILVNSGYQFSMNRRQAFLVTVLSWLFLALFSALPFRLSGLDMSFTDAFFEATSGITTTGSTVISGLDEAPPGILIWRAILQWLGGIGIIIMALSILPYMNVGGMQIFKAERMENEKSLPRATKLASAITVIYSLLTVACAVSYYFAGMPRFDALAHAMATVSTGGFSTHDDSLGHFHSDPIRIVSIIFMTMGGLPFLLYLETIRGNAFALIRDSQVRCYFAALAAFIVSGTAYLIFMQELNPDDALMGAAFNTVSLMTGTGFTSENYDLWGGFITAILFFSMAVGACAGSTTCAIKIFRFQILYAVIVVQMKKLLYPSGVFIAHYNGKPIPDGVPASVMSFLFLFGLSFVVVAMLLSLIGLDFMTSMSGAISAISNAGPGMGSIIGPLGNFEPLPDSAKWVLSAAMLLGRLEIMTVLVILHISFWKS